MSLQPASQPASQPRKPLTHPATQATVVSRETFHAVVSHPLTRARLSSTIAYAASRVCDLTGKKANNGYVVTFSHKRNKKLQQPNLQYKKVYWPEGQRWVKLRICTKAMKTIEKNGLQKMANEAGIDLWKLPFEDARPGRKEWLAAQEVKPPMKKGGRKMKNAEKLAASTKTPLVAEYVSGKIQYVRAGDA